jgi:drug/metabolite transporter (DMT)-like permease
VHLIVGLNGVFIAIIAYALMGGSSVWDKVLLERKSTGNLVFYIFWLGATSIFGSVLVFFGFHFPGWKLMAISMVAGVMDLTGSFFYYWALKVGGATGELTAMGGFAPVATALIGIPLLGTSLHGQRASFTLLTVGGFMMAFAEGGVLRKTLVRILCAVAAFGLSADLQKLVFDQTNFVSGYVFFTLGTTLAASTLLIPASFRRQIFETREDEGEPRSKVQYFVNRFVSGVGSFLAVFAVSRANPALVQALSGLRYVIIFLGAYAITRWRPHWFTENFSRWVLVTKVTATLIVMAGLALASLHGAGSTVAEGH